MRQFHIESVFDDMINDVNFIKLATCFRKRK